MIFVLFICFIRRGRVLDASRFACVVPDEFMYPPPRGPFCPASWVVVAEFFLRADLVLYGTFLEPVCNRRQGSRTQALLFKGQPVPVLVHAINRRDFRQSVFHQPFVEHFDIFVSVRLFRAGVRKQDQVNRDFMQIHSDDHCGAVRSSAERNNVHFSSLSSAAA